MKFEKYTNRELKITAMLYATRKNIVETVKQTGRIPDVIPMGGFPTAMRVLLERRGPDPELTEVEKMVYDAIVRCRKLPGGGVLLVDREDDGKDDDEE
jgi:hypothetical protein